MTTIDLASALERTQTRVQRHHDRQTALLADFRAHHVGVRRTLLGLGYGGLAATAAITVAGGMALFGAVHIGDNASLALVLGFFACFMGGVCALAHYEEVNIEAGAFAERIEAFETKHGHEFAAAVADLANRGWLEVARKDKSDVLTDLSVIARTAGGPAAARAADVLPAVSLFADTLLVWNDRKADAAKRLSEVARLADGVKQAGGDVAETVSFVYAAGLDAEQIAFLRTELTAGK